MRLLLDENLPKQLLNDFPEHHVSTIQQKGWGGKSNGELLKLMLTSEIAVFLTADKNLHHQQNFKKNPIPALVLHVFRLNYNQIKTLVPQIKKILSSASGANCDFFTISFLRVKFLVDFLQQSHSL